MQLCVVGERAMGLVGCGAEVGVKGLEDPLFHSFCLLEREEVPPFNLASRMYMGNLG